jgi:diaminopimelate decarboxylase
LSSVAGRLGSRANISIRINPDVDAGTHEKITTGRASNKFGVSFADAEAIYARAAAAGHRADRRPYAYRQPDHRLSRRFAMLSLC